MLGIGDGQSAKTSGVEDIQHHFQAVALPDGHNAATRSDRWWDKIQICFDTQGRASLQFEHSFSDGLSWNRWLGEVWHAMGLMEAPPKWPYGDLQAASAVTRAATAPRKLEFKLDDASKMSIAKADVHLEQLGGNVDLYPSVFEVFSP